MPAKPLPVSRWLTFNSGCFVTPICSTKMQAPSKGDHVLRMSRSPARPELLQLTHVNTGISHPDTTVAAHCLICCWIHRVVDGIEDGCGSDQHKFSFRVGQSGPECSSSPSPGPGTGLGDRECGWAPHFPHRHQALWCLSLVLEELAGQPAWTPLQAVGEDWDADLGACPVGFLTV